LTDTVLLRFTTVPDASRIVESGTALVPNRWVFFGEPAPRFTTSDGETALELPGDERFTTGILTQRTLSAKDGVGAEFSVSAKITKMQWQAVWASFSAVSDSLLGAWRERSGARPLEWAAATRASHCEMQMPAGEAFRGWRRIGLSIAGSVERIRTAPSGVLEGNWHRMRLQVFPDGRCGVAIDGTPLWLSRGRVETHRPLRFEIAARAVQTSIRVRGIEVWEGVRGGVDWRGAVR
jgi:hypothetical protein